MSVRQAVGDHKLRSGCLAVVLALLLIGAVVTVTRGNDQGGRQGLGQAAGRAGTPTTDPAIDGEGGGPGTSSTDAGTSTGPGRTGAEGGGGNRGSTPANPQPVPGGTQPGVSGGISGAEPVSPRPPVRCAPSGTPRAAPLPPADEQDGRRWVTVGRLAGNCDAASATFPLLGIDTRLVWRSDAESFAVFVVDAVQGREATAGFADGQCAAVCSERQPIVPPAGSYRLEVQAGDAPWEVEIQEYRRP